MKNTNPENLLYDITINALMLKGLTYDSEKNIFYNTDRVGTLYNEFTPKQYESMVRHLLDLISLEQYDRLIEKKKGRILERGKHHA